MISARLPLCVPLLGITALLACSSNGPHALYTADPISNQNPFPDARLLTSDAGLGGRPSAYVPFVPTNIGQGPDFQTYAQVLNQTIVNYTGFGNFGAELVPFSESMNATSVGSAFSYVSLAATPAAGPTARVAYTDDPPFAQVSPSLPLASNSSYALVLTDFAETATGKQLTRAPDFDLRAQGAGKAQLAQAAQVLGIDVQHIVFGMVFTTQNAPSDVQSLAGWVKTSAVPTYVFDVPLDAGAPTPADCANPPAGTQCPQGIFTVDAGTLSAVLPFLTELIADGGPNGGDQDPPTEVGTVIAGTVILKDARDTESGHFQASVVADPSTGRDVARAFVLALPDPANPKTPMPANGYPLVLVGHGLGGSNSLGYTSQATASSPAQANGSLCVTNAQFFAEQGFGCLGIDAPSHGTRGNEVNFFRFDDLTITRDYFREMAFDQMQILRMAASGQLSQFGVQIDPTNLRYFGISLGGIMGSTFLSVDPNSLGGVLNVPGGGLVHIFQSPNIFADLGLILQATIAVPFNEPDGGVSPNFEATVPFITTLAQLILESADPINYAALLPPSKHILMQEGLLDQTVPNLATNDLAAAFGVPTYMVQTTNAAGIDGLWKFDLTKYGLDPTELNPHEIFALLPETRAQAGEYFSTNGTTIQAE